MSYIQAVSGNDSEAMRPLPESLLETEAGQPTLRLERTSPEKTFLAVSDREEDLACLLECFYTAHLIKQRGSLSTAIIVHPKNARLAKHSRLFDDIYEFDSHQSLARQLRRLSPDVVYVPRADARKTIAAFLSGAGLRIAGSKLRLVSRLLGTYNASDVDSLKSLQGKGIDLLPEVVALRIEPFVGSTPKGLPTGPFVWVSLFDSHDLNGSWPLSHAARLARMAEKLDVKLVSHVPSSVKFDVLVKELTYLKRNAPNLTILDSLTPEDRASVMVRAAAVVGPAGPDMILAAMLRRPSVVLHDMRTGKAGIDTRAHSSRSVLIKFADAVERQVIPAVDQCIDHCPTCAFQSCVEYISPERVFEQIKRYVMPF